MQKAGRGMSAFGARVAAGALGVAFACQAAMATEPFPLEVGRGRDVVMLRHAAAPGVGDRENFRRRVRQPEEPERGRAGAGKTAGQAPAHPWHP